jgi:hypothetical protein
VFQPISLPRYMSSLSRQHRCRSGLIEKHGRLLNPVVLVSEGSKRRKTPQFHDLL